MKLFEKIRNRFGTKPAAKTADRRFDVRLKIFYQGTESRALIGEMNITIGANTPKEAEQIAMQEFQRGLFLSSKTYRIFK